jgi:hypothetical protein
VGDKSTAALGQANNAHRPGKAALQAFLLNKFLAEGGIGGCLRDWQFYQVNKRNNMLYLGSLLHKDVRTVAYALVTFCEFCTFIGNRYDLHGSIVFLIKGDARLRFGLLKIWRFRKQK